MTSAPGKAVSVWMERRAVASRWVSHEWRAAAVVEAADSAARAGCVRVDGFEVSLHRDEAEGYHLNSSSPSPSAFVMWRLSEPEDGTEAVARPCSVTLSYNEAARLMDAQERVDAVPLPPALAIWLADYAAAHYRPEPKKKRLKASFVAPDRKAML